MGIFSQLSPLQVQEVGSKSPTQLRTFISSLHASGDPMDAAWAKMLSSGLAALEAAENRAVAKKDKRTVASLVGRNPQNAAEGSNLRVEGPFGTMLLRASTKKNDAGQVVSTAWITRSQMEAIADAITALLLNLPTDEEVRLSRQAREAENIARRAEEKKTLAAAKRAEARAAKAAAEAAATVAPSPARRRKAAGDVVVEFTPVGETAPSASNGAEPELVTA